MTVKFVAGEILACSWYNSRTDDTKTVHAVAK